ncbi:Cupin 2 conserved barrel domain protein [Emticicia oligotrophica DSM 17448]|uniref:Cupin 2 conserved barrel domain protein n=1 Tax=Emticicia oligotrophica (strain DSM 17448 / CIP 109782 / MTCC 6937 / GPTSA100-15) TaxID=929562 RepID=A0ABM5MY84_EMTOG|nr:cupin domain-containing protein [Emticicia oligotrophica]AFK02100.1 Cupin 2 conserved barrel domain protein [Emticicia oligotrophica DSM 17448]
MQRRNFIQATLAAFPVIANPSKLTDGNRSPKGFTVGAGKDRFNQPIKYRGVNPNDVKISSKDTDGQLSVFEYVGFQKIGPQLHVHFDQDEIFYVVEGEYLFQVGDERSTLKAGDTIFLPRAVPHTWLQLTDKGKLVYFLQPAGKMEEFFKKMNELQGPPTPELVQQIHQAHGMKVVGPPITL